MPALSPLKGEIRWETKTSSALKQRIGLVDPGRHVGPAEYPRGKAFDV